MTADLGAAKLSTSLPSRENTGPSSRTWFGSRSDDEILLRDKASRKYTYNVERSLSSFDTALQDWADYISFLGRLLKSLQSHPQTCTVIPFKAVVAKRLAQCMHPDLPSGVHQKALQVYEYIFFTIGKDDLSRDIAIYLPGLSSTLSFASLAVRSPFLKLLESYVLELAPRALRPPLKAIILALLPGLEETSSEDFERTLSIVDGFRAAIRKDTDAPGDNLTAGDEYFWQCFFLASITSDTRRSGSLAYLERHLPRLGADVGSSKGNAGSSTIIATVTSPEPGLLLRCFATGLADPQLLIQRGFLDLLVSHLPLHAGVLQHLVKREDMDLLMIAASGVVTRRDMSLNRRLWTWLLGPESNFQVDDTMSSSLAGADDGKELEPGRNEYFERHGLRPLTSALLKMIREDCSIPAERAKPLRICLSLMDKWEIGGLIIPEVFLPVIESVRVYGQKASQDDFNEVLRSASVFFDGVESGLIWGEVLRLIYSALDTTPNVMERRLDSLKSVAFVLRNFNVREEEMLLVHAPYVTLMLLALTRTYYDKHLEGKAQSSETIQLMISALEIMILLVDLVPKAVYQSTIQRIRPVKPHTADDRGELSTAMRQIQMFYSQLLEAVDAPMLPVPIDEVSKLLLDEAVQFLTTTIRYSTMEGVTTNSLALTSILFNSLMENMADLGEDNRKSLVGSIRLMCSSNGSISFAVFSSLVQLVIALHSHSYIPGEDMEAIVDAIVRIAWSHLSPSHPQHHVEAARLLHQLQLSLSPASHDIEASLCDVIAKSLATRAFSNSDADPGKRFGILWTHLLNDNPSLSEKRKFVLPVTANGVVPKPIALAVHEAMLGRPLFLLLDALVDERTQLFMTVRSWLQGLQGVDSLFNIFIVRLVDVLRLKQNQAGVYQGADVSILQPNDHKEMAQCIYYLQRLSVVLRWSTDTVWASLAKTVPVTDNIHHSTSPETGQKIELTFQEVLAQICVTVVDQTLPLSDKENAVHITQLQRTALTVLHQILNSAYATPLSSLHLEQKLIVLLHSSLDCPDPYLQVSLLDVLFAALKLERSMVTEQKSSQSDRIDSDSQADSARVPSSMQSSTYSHQIPQDLVHCLRAGLSSWRSRPVLDSWIAFLAECLPFYPESIFQLLIPLVETFCNQVSQIFVELKQAFEESVRVPTDHSAPESTLVALLSGLEQVLAHGHKQLLVDTSRMLPIKNLDQAQGFFGNMVSGVFSSDNHQARISPANNRLTVLLSFQDAVRMCFTVWNWDVGSMEDFRHDLDSAASLSYTSLRVRNRARRLLEHLFAAEALECLETVVEIWQKAEESYGSKRYTAICNLLHVLDGSRPKHTVPAIFDAIYSRTMPSILDPSRRSTLTSSLTDVDLIVFLVEYVGSLEDDTMVEIWSECMTFIREVLNNPLPHRQILPSLLEFATTIAEKVDNTSFGEQKKLRRDLADLFLRLLTTTFTAKPVVHSEITSVQTSEHLLGDESGPRPSERLAKATDVVQIVRSITSSLSFVLLEPDRIVIASQIISSNTIAPLIRSKLFPHNVTKGHLELLHDIAGLQGTQKVWQKDVGDAFNDSRFFSSTHEHIQNDWLSLLRQWTIGNKERMPELLTRLSSPTTAGIVFGVGATSARLEADRRTQLNLRRIATLILTLPDDAFASDLGLLQEKVVDLFHATPTSSPSSITRAEIFLLLRAVCLKMSSIHLSFLWPVINAELHSTIPSVLASGHDDNPEAETYNNHAVLQACKLLDMLLCISPEEFQPHEWLYITDTTDAVYRPRDHEYAGLIDQLADELGSSTLTATTHTTHIVPDKLWRQPLLGPRGIQCDSASCESRKDLIVKILMPFFSQLSIFAFERTYEMTVLDRETCRRNILADLFDDRGVAKGA